MHAKRQTIGRAWPIPRKGTKYLIVTSHERRNGIPILVMLREVMKLADNRKEAKKILNEGLIKVNGKEVRKDNFPLLPFDILTIKDKEYEISFSDKGKFEAGKRKHKETILKVINKKMLKNKKVQLNLLYGKNFITNEKAAVGDSVMIKDKKIVKTIKIEKGRKAVVFAGKNRGEEGEIIEIKNKIVTINSKEAKINVPERNVMALE
jgi:small subunit ribosomal protein S4e